MNKWTILGLITAGFCYFKYREAKIIKALTDLAVLTDKNNKVYSDVINQIDFNLNTTMLDFYRHNTYLYHGHGDSLNSIQMVKPNITIEEEMRLVKLEEIVKEQEKILGVPHTVYRLPDQSSS